ncbi:DUF4221 family protein [Fulvivirgaceae bacterium PWU5]|uniref:DUF4221 family protein n=1 Tax=Dawidia cretensis TaxID=2782350 RepID=A0AAP2GUR9_9BACT|nr:DUF4221 family protein [Dawidia cretensis]MBT1707892.1 DUF4221 family protein [Dawidia cretensis]
MNVSHATRFSQLLLAIYLFDHCTPAERPPATEEATYTLASQGIIEIPIDSASMNYSVYPVHYVNDTSELYVDGNDFINGIDFYDLNNRRRINRILFPLEGKDGLKFAKKLYIHSLDSIFIYRDNERELVLADYTGKIKKRYALPPPPRMQWMANMLQSFIVRNGYAYFSNRAFGGDMEQAGHKLFVRYNLQTGEHEEYGPAYSDFPLGDANASSLPFYAFGHDHNIVIRLDSQPDLYIYNMNTDSTMVVPMKSRYAGAPILADTTVDDFDPRDYETLTKDSYPGIYYSPYDHMYYAIFSKGIPVTNAAGERNDYEDRPLSIILFDESFKKCGEVQLADFTYFRNFICSKKGLLIPRSHLKNPENDESKIQFEIFRPQAL